MFLCNVGEIVFQLYSCSFVQSLVSSRYPNESVIIYHLFSSP